MSLCAAGLFVVLGMGIEGGTDRHHYGREPTGIAGIECMITEEWSMDYIHNSSIPDGPPFNGKEDFTSDVIALTYRFKIK